MADVTSIVPPKTRRHYSHESINLEAVYDALTHKMKPGAIKELSKISNIPIRTLEGWKLKLSGAHGDASWPPYISGPIRHRAFTETEEAYLADYIRSRYLATNLFLSPALISILARRLRWNLDNERMNDTDDWTLGPRVTAEEIEVEDANTDMDDETDEDAECQLDDDENDDSEWEQITAQEFRATNRWRKNFMRRWGFIIRKPHAQRRPQVCNEAVAKFLQEIFDVFDVLKVYPSRIFNCDETS
jgi:hypothetical protein